MIWLVKIFSNNKVCMKIFYFFQKRVGGKIDKREEKGSNRRRSDRDEEGGSGPKPSGQVSLFAFLEDKLPVHSGRLICKPQEVKVFNICQCLFLHGLSSLVVRLSCPVSSFCLLLTFCAQSVSFNSFFHVKILMLCHCSMIN